MRTRLVSLPLIFFLQVAAWSQETDSPKAEPAETEVKLSKDEQLTVLVKQLQSGNDDERRAAARQLRDLESREESVIAAIGRATRDKDRQVYSLAAEAIARLGPDGAPAMNFFIDRLEDDDQQRRYRAAYALGRMGAAAVPSLQKVISAGIGRHRVEAAVRALAWCGKDAEPAIPALISALAHEKEDVAQSASETLWKIGEVSTDALLGALASDNSQSRRLAVTSLGQMQSLDAAWASKIGVLLDDSDAAIRAAATRSYSYVARTNNDVPCDALIQRLQDSEADVRKEAAMGVIRVPRCWQAALPIVRLQLKGEAEDVAMAAHILERMGPLAVDAVDDLLDGLHSNQNAREAIAAALSQIGPAIVPPLLDQIRSGTIDSDLGRQILRHADVSTELAGIVVNDNQDMEKRVVAAKLLGSVVPVLDSSLSCLTTGLKSEQTKLRMACVLGLGAMGHSARSAEAVVRTAAESDSSEEVQAAALTALFKIGVAPDSLADAITAGLKSHNAEIRRECARAMGRFESLTSEQVAILSEVLDDTDATIRQSAVEALSKASEPNEQLIADLVKMLDDDSEQVTGATYSTIGKIGSAAKSAVPSLIEKLEITETRIQALQTLEAIGEKAQSATGPVKTLVGHDADDVRATALVTLAKIHKDRPELVIILSDRLEDEEWAVRKQAATLLGAEGESAISAVPALLTLLLQEDDSDYARNALRGIDAAPPEALPQLVSILADGSSRRARYYAMHLLKKVGPAAKQVVPQLQEILDQDKFDSRTQRYLKQVIEEIEDQEDEIPDEEKSDEDKKSD